MATYTEHLSKRIGETGVIKFASGTISNTNEGFLSYANQLKDDNSNSILTEADLGYIGISGRNFAWVDEYPIMWKGYCDSKILSLGTVYHAQGSKTVAYINSLTAKDTADMHGWVFNLSDAGKISNANGLVVEGKDINVLAGDQILINEYGKIDKLHGIDYELIQPKLIQSTTLSSYFPTDTPAANKTVENFLIQLYTSKQDNLPDGNEGQVLKKTETGVEWANEYTYTHPTHTAAASGLYKVAVDNQGHVSSTTAVQKSDITALGIPGAFRIYGTASTTAISPTEVILRAGTNLFAYYGSAASTTDDNAKIISFQTDFGDYGSTYIDPSTNKAATARRHGLVPPSTHTTSTDDERKQYFLNEQGEWALVQSGVTSVTGKNGLKPTSSTTGAVEIGINWTKGDNWRIPTSMSGTIDDNRSSELWSDTYHTKGLLGVILESTDGMYKIGKLGIDFQTQNFTSDLLEHNVGTSYQPLTWNMTDYNNLRIYAPLCAGTVPDTGSNFFCQMPSSVNYDVSPSTGAGWYDWSPMDTAKYYMMERLLTYGYEDVPLVDKDGKPVLDENGKQKTERRDSVNGVQDAKQNQATVLNTTTSKLPGQSTIKYYELRGFAKDNLKALATEKYGINFVSTSAADEQKIYKWFYENNNQRLPEFSTSRNPGLYQISLWNMCKNGGYIGYDCRESTVVTGTYSTYIKGTGSTPVETEYDYAGRVLKGKYAAYQRAHYWSNLTNGMVVFSKMQDQEKAKHWPFLIAKDGDTYSLAYKDRKYSFSWPKYITDCTHGDYDTYMRPKFNSAPIQCKLTQNTSTSAPNPWKLLVATSSIITELEVSIGGHGGKLRFSDLLVFEKYKSASSQRKLKSLGKCTIEWYDDNVKKNMLKYYEFMVRISPHMWMNTGGAYTCNNADMEVFVRINKDYNTTNITQEVYGTVTIPSGAKFITNYDDLQEVPSILNVDSGEVTNPSPLTANAEELPAFICNNYGFLNNPKSEKWDPVDDTNRTSNFYAFADDVHKSFRHPGSHNRTNSNSYITWSDWNVNGNTRTRTGEFKEYTPSWKTGGAYGENLWAASCQFRVRTTTETETYDEESKSWKNTVSNTVTKSAYTFDSNGNGSSLADESSYTWTKFPESSTDYTIYPRAHAFNVAVTEYKGAAFTVNSGEGITITGEDVKTIAITDYFYLKAWNEEDDTVDTYKIYGTKVNS